MYFVLCIVCCVSQYCIVPTTKCKKCFKGNYITMYFVLCIVCCVVYCLLCITVLCCANNQMQICLTKFNFFHKYIIYFVQISKCFFECCRFLNACMQCSVDVTESVVELLRVWCSYAVIPLAGLSRHFAGRWRPWACYATNHKNFI